MRMPILLFFAILLAPLAWSEDNVTMAEWLKKRHRVVDIISADTLIIQFEGLETAVHVAHLQAIQALEDKAIKWMRQEMFGKRVIIIPEGEHPITASGLPEVYLFMRESDDVVFMNEEILRQGFVAFEKISTKQFAKYVTKLEDLAATVQPPPDFRTQKTTYVSELNSNRYHKEDCKWCKQIPEQSRIEYDSFDAAEKTGKQPCSNCLFDRVKELQAASSSEGKSEVLEKVSNHLVGLKSDTIFYSPVAKKVARANVDGLVLFASEKEAIDSGRKPDPGSLRINNPVVPAATGDECHGRALPYYRPCRRPHDNHPTQLCEACRNGRIR